MAEMEGKGFSLLDASISDLQHALSAGHTTSVDLVSRYLRRIITYDANGPKLSAIPLLNAGALEEAAASDAWRAAGHAPRPLEGIPYLVKDSIKVKGMTVANGSPAFETLVATEDAACVQILREAGAVLLGRTNMPAMAYGGMQRGSWGRAESPYNPEYLAAAYASGSSNGSAVATTSNFCAFSLGSETVSSGRSPASNNAIVAYTPSKGLLPLRGVFPLYPTCDVLVPHTRTVMDLFHVLDVLAVKDKAPVGDFYNEQNVVPIPSVESIRPKSFLTLAHPTCLRGKRIGVPSMYIGGDDSSLAPISKVRTRESIIKLWQEARGALESLGAEVVETDFPLVTKYEANAASGQLVTVDNLPDGWPAKERCEVVAHAWDDFLAVNGQEDLKSLTSVDPATIFPLAPGSLLGAPEAANKPRWGEIVEYPRNKPDSILDIPGIHQAIRALEDARKETFEKWMDNLGLRRHVDEQQSMFAWSNGVKYSNGNRPIRHLGVPTISIPMGIMEDTQMPVNLTFAGKAYEDTALLQYGYAFEMATKRRVQPPRVPALDSDQILRKSITRDISSQNRLELSVDRKSKKLVGAEVQIHIEGSLNADADSISCYINGQPYKPALMERAWSIVVSYPSSERDEPWKRWSSPALTQTTVLIKASSSSGAIAGKLVIL
ncbi:Amidase [Penicillium chermesinum]|uniref:Amidase n=1 Tax=Penicillium chermesinum TaxID=63820 RepID=A0A9W9TZ93_9EURO|nr:Amidase [Penicillium chermesinum]KAJ5247104.1 Amidase [Penicillium chermesinum]